MLINMGVDLGYSYVKGKSKLDELKFDSYIKEVTETEAKHIQTTVKKLNENNILIKYDEKYFVIGNLAINHFPSLVKRVSPNRDVVQVKALYIGCMGLLCDSLAFDVNLSVGTPNRSRTEKDSLEKLLRGMYNYTYLTRDGEIKKTIKIKDTYAMPQPVACAFTLSPEDREQYNILVIDIGHGTTDTMYLSAGLIASSEAGLRYNSRGIERCYKLLKDRLLASDLFKKYNILDVNERELQKIIEYGIYTINKTELEVKDILEKSLVEYIDEIFYDIEGNYHHVLRQADIIFASGGVFSNTFVAKYLAGKFKEDYSIMFITEQGDAQMSVCKGLYNFANEYFEDDFTAESKEDN